MSGPRPSRPHRQERVKNRALRAAAQVASGDDGPIILFGVHAVEAALRNPSRRCLRLAVTENGARKLQDALAGRSSLPVERVSPRDLDRQLGADTVHQGMMLEVEPLDEPSLDDVVRGAESGGPVVALDQVTDPHNVGAVMRSAAVFGASGLIMTRRHSPPLNGTLAKSASGALELVPAAERAAAQALHLVRGPVQLQHAAAPRPLVQAVHVLGDDVAGFSHADQAGHRMMSGIGLRISPA